MESMEKVVQCDCGFEARAEHEDGLVAEVQRHAAEVHGMTLSLEEALLLAFQAELGDPWAHRPATQPKTTPREAAPNKEER
jgi:predicted small metal-binding protein